MQLARDHPPELLRLDRDAPLREADGHVVGHELADETTDEQPQVVRREAQRQDQPTLQELQEPPQEEAQLVQEPDFSVRADTPLYAVFKRPDGARTYLAFNAGKTALKVSFSDGKTLEVPPGSLGQAR